MNKAASEPLLLHHTIDRNISNIGVDNNIENNNILLTAKRLKHWSVLTLFSAVSFGSIYENTDDSHDDGDQDAIVRFVLIIAAVTIFIGPMFMINSKWTEFTGIKNFLNGTLFELLISTLLLILWGICLGFINMRDIGGGATKNANIYYFSWGAFLSSVVLWSDVTNEFFDTSAIFTRHSRIALWTFESACTIIVMSTSSADYKNDCDNASDGTYCNRLVYGIAIGATSSFISLFILVLLHNAQSPTDYLQIETNSCAIIALAYAFGTYYLTGADGPAKAIGNLYYFTWLSFLSAVILFLDCFDKITSSYRNEINSNQIDNNARFAILTICSEEDSEGSDDGHHPNDDDDDDSGSPFFECDDGSCTEDPHQNYSTGTGNLTNPNQGYYSNHYNTAW